MAVAGGEGTLRFPGYKTAGIVPRRGLRNKRKAYWAKIRMAKLIADRNKERQLLAKMNQASQEWNQDYSAYQ